MDGLWKFLENEGIRPQQFSDAQPKAEKGSTSWGKKREEAGEKSSRNQRENQTAGKKETVKETSESKCQEPTEYSFKPRNRVDDVKEQLDLFNEWRTWKDLITWGEETEGINSRSRATCYQIVDKLKLGRKFSPWLRQEMESIWKIAIKNGFKPKLS
jgi:hypothetical protein